MNIKTDNMKYSKDLIEEIESLVKSKSENLNYSIDEFENEICFSSYSWNNVYNKLSDKFIQSFNPFITKLNKNNEIHGKFFYGTIKRPVLRSFFVKRRKYGELLDYTYN